MLNNGRAIVLENGLARRPVMGLTSPSKSGARSEANADTPGASACCHSPGKLATPQAKRITVGVRTAAAVSLATRFQGRASARGARLLRMSRQSHQRRTRSRARAIRLVQVIHRLW